VVSSVAEAEFGAVFVNAKEGTVTCTTLSEMGHKKTPQNSKLTTPQHMTSSITQTKALQSNGHEILLGKRQG
jgi:hypothetical protein